MKKSYIAVVKEGKIFLNEPTDLAEGTEIQLTHKESSYQPLIQQIAVEEENPQQTRVIDEIPDDIRTQTSTKKESENSFEKFGFNKLITPAINMAGYTIPTLIQNQAIKPILDKRDVLGTAKTGSGKTAAFALPILNNLLKLKPQRKKQPKVLIISPTRELAIQIGVSFDTYGKFTQLKQVTIFGGVKQKNQVDQLRDGWIPILIATPGRLLDLMRQKIITLDHVETLVLDEADRMLDMGFIPDIKKIVSNIPHREQSLLFSATMPKEILDLAKSFLKKDFIHVTGDQTSIPVDKIKQEIYFVEKGDKLELLENILSHRNISKTLIFSRTKYGADKLARKLKRQSYTIDSLHGNKSQGARQRALSNFKENRTQILVATDLAARGLDVDDITHVINYDMPSEPETFLHRIGRTARAGKSGTAISFCQEDQRKYFAPIERLLGFHIPRAIDNPVPSIHEEPLPTDLDKKKAGDKGNKYSRRSSKGPRKKKSRRSQNRKNGVKLGRKHPSQKQGNKD